jgi:hypothetical protein
MIEEALLLSSPIRPVIPPEIYVVDDSAIPARAYTSPSSENSRRISCVTISLLSFTINHPLRLGMLGREPIEFFWRLFYALHGVLTLSLVEIWLKAIMGHRRKR